MAKRRFQNPEPEMVGNFWYVRIWHDVFVEGERTRKRQRVKLAPASMPDREVKKIAAEILRSVNQGLVTVGSAVNFSEYVCQGRSKNRPMGRRKSRPVEV